MKKLFTLIICSFIAINGIKADGGEFELGINYGYMSVQNVNRYVYVYNYTRPWLFQKMDYFNSGKGYFFSYNKFFNEHLGLGTGMSNIKSVHTAFGKEPSSGSMGYRKIKVGSTTMFGAMHIRFIQTRFFELAFVPTIDVNFNSITLTYATDEKFSNGVESKLIVKPSIGSTLGVSARVFTFDWLAFSVKPFIAFQYFKSDVSEMTEELQSVTSPFETPESFTVKGITFSIVFSNRQFD